MSNIHRGLHHLSALTLEDLEKKFLLMNLITQRGTEVFQVTKIGKEWVAYFNIDSMVFAQYKKDIAKRETS